MITISKNDLIDRIDRECFLHKNTSFDYEAYKCYWHEAYSSKKVFNFWGKAVGFKWVDEKSNSSYRALEEADDFFKSLSLPNGLACSFIDIMDSDGTQSEPVREYDHARKQYNRKYIIHVSKSYCDSIVNKAVSTKLFYIREVSSSLMDSANSFKDKLKREHSDIVKEIFTKFDLCYTTIDRKGVDIYSDRSEPLFFKNWGLKDFTEEYQVLGLALAVIDYAIPFLNDAEYFSLDYKRSTSDIFSATIHKEIVTYPQELTEW